MVDNVGGTPFWLGFSIDFWDWLGSRLLLAAVAAGIFAALASGVSSWISSEVTGRVQDIAGHRITAAELNLQKSVEETVRLGAVVAEANARAAEANRIAESERLARIKIEAALASRRLTGEQMSKLTAGLAAVARDVPVINITQLGDKEAFEFADDIMRAIHGSGIQIRLTRVGVMSSPPYGLLVEDVTGGKIRSALSAAGIEHVAYAPSTSPTPSILVGLKPAPF